MIQTALALALLGSTAAAQEETYHVGHHEKFVNVTFESAADIETIVGTTNKATGELKVDLAKETGSISVAIPVKPMTTGIALRDEYMRSPAWLDEAKHPDISFKSKKIEKVKDKPGRLAVTGDFAMHGVTKEITVEVEWKALPPEAGKKLWPPAADAKWVRFTTEFTVKLSEYGVKIDERAVGAVDDAWKVKMTLFASTAKLPEKK